MLDCLGASPAALAHSAPHTSAAAVGCGGGVRPPRSSGGRSFLAPLCPLAPHMATASKKVLSLPTERRCLRMSTEDKAIKVEQAKGLAKWFRVELTISIFGHEILHWVYPPENERR